MKITPLEIRQKTFEKKIRGYDKDEVNAFLLSLSQEWERMIDSSKELKYRLEVSENEVKKLREVESSLFKTLKTAEDTGANMIQQANKTAELHLRETQMNADSILNESKAKAKKIIEDASIRSSKALEETEKKIKELFQVYKSLQMHKETLVSEIDHLANDSLEKIKKIASQSIPFDLDKVFEKMNQGEPLEINKPKNEENAVPKKTVEVVKEEGNKKNTKDKSNSSFFDEIE